MKSGRVEQILGPCTLEFRKTLPTKRKGHLNHFEHAIDPINGLAALEFDLLIGKIGQPVIRACRFDTNVAPDYVEIKQ
jgi:hypothetical protein